MATLPPRSHSGEITIFFFSFYSKFDYFQKDHAAQTLQNPSYLSYPSEPRRSSAPRHDRKIAHPSISLSHERASISREWAFPVGRVMNESTFH